MSENHELPEKAGAPMTRRQLLEQAAAATGIAAIWPQVALSTETGTKYRGDAIMSHSSSETFAYVGCRTTKERGARGEGLSVYHIDAETAEWTLVQVVKDLTNPSFLTFDRGLTFDGGKRHLYTVHGDFSEVSAFRIDPKTGQLVFVARQSTMGKNPVHLAFDATNRFLVVANYAGGAVVSLPVDANGVPGQVCDMASLPGEHGPHRIEQTASHPHEVAFDRQRRFLVVPDKGLDKIFVFTVSPDTGKLTPNDPPWVLAPEGAGPRHIDFHPTKPFAYVVNELNSTLTAYAWDQAVGTLRALQVLASTPATYTGNNRAAEIVISADGNHLYVSNRGHDSIGLFTVDGTSGLLTPVAWTSTQGKGPRFFAFDPSGRHLYAANELTDTIVRFAVDRPSGRLSAAGGQVITGSPVCIAFAVPS